MRILLLAAATSAFFLSSLAWGQANVNEAQETALIYVDAASGSDANPGSAVSPFQTIGKALSVAQSNNVLSIGTRVTINPGIYREALNLNKIYNTTSLPITLQAAVNGTVTITGAVSFKGWNTYSGNPAISTGVWQNQWGFCSADGGNAPYEPPIVLRREMVSVNGAPLTQVLSLTQMVYPGTFFVDETADLIYVWPPAGTNMSIADVEVATLPTLLTISGMSNVAIRGLTFTNANSCHDAPAVLVGGAVNNLLFDTDTFSWNNGQGLSINYPAGNVTVLNSVSNHNGATGFQSYETLNALYLNDTASYNNWRGAQGVYYEWNTGGAHLFSDHSQTITGLTSAYNQTFGIHWDTDVQKVSVTGLKTYQNMSGVLVEKAQGPVSIDASQICSTLNTNPGEGGVVLRNAQSVSLTNSTLWNNAGSQILITGVAGGIASSNWETQQQYNLITQNATFSSNVVTGIGSQQVFKDGYLNGSDWTSFYTTLNSNGNTWWKTTNATPFNVPLPVAGTQVDFTGWQGVSGRDTGSVFAAPAVDPSDTCAVPADAPDWQLLANSPSLTTDVTGAAVFNLTMAAIGGMTGTVALAADGVAAIPDASIAFSPASAAIPGTSAMTFTAGTKTPAGTYLITALANSGNVTRTATFSVTVPVQTVRISTANLSYWNQPVNTSSPAQSITVTNLGTANLAFSSIAVTYGFSQTNTCGAYIASGKSCSITVTFSPHSLITYNGSLTITDSDAISSPQIIGLTGTTVGSAGVKLSPSSLSYGNQVFQKPSAAQLVTITNNGTATLSITSISITGANPADFTQTNTCSLPIAINGTCTVSVVFTPTGSGKRTASLSIADNATGSPQTLSLTGNEITAVQVTPKTLGFGQVKVGVTSPVKTVTVTNLSTAALAMTQLTITGANPAEFQQTNNCLPSLAGGASCSINVTLTPNSSGSKSATLNMNDSDPGGTQTVTLNGSGK